jgi:hypothetical protein
MGALALPGLLWSIVSGYTLLPSSLELHDQGARAALPYLPFAAAATIPLLVIGVSALRSLPRSHAALLLTILATTVLGPFVGRLLFADLSINPRYAMAGAPSFFVLLGAGAPERRAQRVRWGAAVLLLLLMATGSALHLAEPGHGREDIRAAGAWLDANVPKDERILVTSNEMAELARFQWPDRRFEEYPAPGSVVTRGTAEHVARELPIAGADRTIYIFGREWVSDPEGALREALSARYQRCPGARVRGIEIICLVSPKS